MESWYIYAILDSLFAAFAAIFAKIGLENVNSLTAAAIRSIFMMVFILIIALSLEKSSFFTSFSSKNIIFIILSAIAGALSWIFYFLALQKGDVVPVAVIDRSSILFVIILSILLLNENLSTKTIIASIFIVIGIYLLSI
ncbi:MAG: EamA family transporter [Nanopusillaceae archaeon]